MGVDINEKVLAAFQAEHKEHLEGIRSVLSELEFDQTSQPSERMNEAFRLAHSLKGGARVCDLRPAETLAHGLENVFEEVRGGTLRLEKDVVKTIHIVLDAIEDWMAALNRDEEPVDPQEALKAVERLMDPGRGETPQRPAVSEDLKQRLIQAFCREYPAYLAGLWQFSGDLGEEERKLSAEDREEAYRLAHNLRGSAQAASIASIEDVSIALESLLSDLRDSDLAADVAGSEKLRQYLRTLKLELDRLAKSADAPSAAAVRLKRLESRNSQSLPSEAPIDGALETPAYSARNVDTVRISTESLDRLLRTSRQLVTESACQDQVSRRLEGIQSQLQQLKRERESIRRTAAASWHQLSTLPDFQRLANYFDSVDRGIQSLARDTRQLAALQKRNAWLMQSRARQIQDDVRQTRMVSAETVYQSLRKLVRDLAKAEGKEVEFRVSGFDVRADRMVFQTLKDPLIHMLRNCIVHGIESSAERTKAGKTNPSRIELRMEIHGNHLTIEVDDDGRGIDRDRIGRRAIENGLISRTELTEYSGGKVDDLIFQSGFSTSEHVTEMAGRGMGLSVVKNAVTRLQGTVQVCPKPSAGAKFRISVPLCVSTHRLLLVSANQETYAIPLSGIERLLTVKSSEVEHLEGQPVVRFENQFLPLVSLANALRAAGVGGLKVQGSFLQIIILKTGPQRIAFGVDCFLAEKDLLIQELDEFAANKAYLGASLLEEGEAVLVLDPAGFSGCDWSAEETLVVEAAAPHWENRTPRVLVVDDSFTTRTLEKSILEANGYEVAIAVDGVEGLQQLRAGHYDLVISDVEMPRMDGFSLLEAIKQDARLSSIPVIMVTSRMRREDQEKGLDLGAEAYIVKQKFDHEALLNTIRQIVDPKKELVS